MDLQAIEARLRANEAGRDGELYEHAPEDIRALIDEIKRLHTFFGSGEKRIVDAAEWKKLEAVKELHRLHVCEDDRPNCWIGFYGCMRKKSCDCCYEQHPCSTLRALGVTE